jgi:hypothetical protein
VRTSASGEYAFRGLHKGKYTLSVISKCETCNFNQEYVVKEAQVTSEDQDLVMPDFVIKD